MADDDLLTRNLNTGDSAPDAGIRVMEVFNSSANDLPGFCLLRITGEDSDGVITVDVPNANSQVGLLVNFPCVLPAGGYGQAHQDFPASVLFEAGEGTPAVGQEWGTIAGDCKLHPGKTGYKIKSVGTTDYATVAPAVGGAEGDVPPCRGAQVTVVTNVCPIFQTINFGGSVGTHQIQVGTSVEYGLLDTCSGLIVTRWCVDNPSGCCSEDNSGSGVGDCIFVGGCSPMPAQLCMTVSAPGCCLDGMTFALTHNGITAGQPYSTFDNWASPFVSIPGCIDPFFGVVDSFQGWLAFDGSAWIIGVAYKSLFVTTFYPMTWRECDLTGAPVFTLANCSPFTLTVSGSVPAGAANVCSGIRMTLNVSSDMSACAGDSGSGDSGSGGCAPISTALGANSVQSSEILTLTNVSVTAGTLLLVNVGMRGTTAVPPAVTFAGITMTEAVGDIETFSGVKVGAYIYYLLVGSDTTGDIVADTGSAGTVDLVLSAVQVSGLINNGPDQANAGTGSSTTPSAGAITTTADCGYIQAAVLTNGPNTDAVGTWGGGFTAGGQDEATTRCILSEGYQIITSGTYTASKSGITSRAWIAVECSFT